MTRVRMLSMGGLLRGLIAAGHAGHGAHGGDIVCAGASAIVQSAALGMRRQGLPVRIKKSDVAGYLSLRLRPNATAAERASAHAALQSALSGLRALQQQYPAHVQVRARMNRHLPAKGETLP